ncbi:MAG: response regulator [Anaerolineae bacterium]|nr:MAG: response regulator [Anaerolineae bacterium]
MHTPPLILIADDDSDTAGLLERICKRTGYDVQIATDGVSAIAMIRELLPDLILLDVQMPLMDGFQVLRELDTEEETRHIPSIIITAAATKTEDVVRGIDTGANDYIFKPFNYHELLARISAKLRESRLKERLRKRTEDLEALVALGVELNQPLGVRHLAERLLQFLKRSLKANISLLQIDAHENRPALTLMLHDDISEVKLAVEPAMTQGVHVLSPEETRELFSDSRKVATGIAAPLLHHNNRLGFLLVGYYGYLSDAENDYLRLMSSVSEQASLAIRNTQLLDELRGYANQLESRVEERTRELQAAQKLLIRSEKMASLGRLAGEIAHEINNPLQPIRSCLEYAIENLQAGDVVDAADLNVAISEVERLSRTVRRLLDFARPESSNMAQVNLKELVSDTLLLTRKKMEHSNISLKTDLQNVPFLQGNADQLKQVILNLAINAADAMSEKGGTMIIRLWSDKEQVHFVIKDEGTGIPSETLTQIFEPFYSTKMNGSGLGLAISHSIIEAHGGQMQVKSEVGVGSEFQITLPLR